MCSEYLFRVILEEEVLSFIEALEAPCRKKRFARIDRARRRDIRDPQAFKKLERDIWEFRARCREGQVRLLSFWDKADPEDTLVVGCYAVLKDQATLPKAQLDRVVRLRSDYFANKLK